MLWYIIASCALAVSVSGHGRVLDPPSRASAWRFGFPTTPDYDDDGRNCGGFSHQHEVVGGKCGICGDPYDQLQPRDHELGGTWGDGVIVAQFTAGQVFSATVDLTAYHKGYWQFKICTDPTRNDQACFDENILELESGGNKYYPNKDAKYTMTYRLPSDLYCEHCVLQWQYIAGNNWGICKNGTTGLGCGNQEQFGACSDIRISVPLANAEKKPATYYQRLGYLDVQANNGGQYFCTNLSAMATHVLLQLLDKVRPRPKVRVGPPRPEDKPIIKSNKHKRKRKGKKNKPRKRKKI